MPVPNNAQLDDMPIPSATNKMQLYFTHPQI